MVIGQRLMQASSDIFLGWIHVESPLDGRPRDFYGRQLKDWKGSAEIDAAPAGDEHLRQAVRLDPRARPRPHRRSRRDCVLPRQRTSVRPALLEFSKAYADQNERDYQRLVNAVNSGEITAQTGL